MSALSATAGARLRIGITQRRIASGGRAEARDALDVGWYEYIRKQWPDAVFVALPNLQPAEAVVGFVRDWEIDALVFSGGEDVGSSPVRDACEAALLAHARDRSMAVLGICRGMQFLHMASGGQLRPSTQPLAEPHEVRHAEASAWVNSYHRWAIADVASEWQALAWAADETVEAMRHRALPWLACMWHPERPQGGERLLVPWLDAWWNHATAVTR